MRPGLRISSCERKQITTGSPVLFFRRAIGLIMPSDKAAILAYNRMTNIILEERDPDVRLVLKRINTALDMIKKAYGGVTCLTCGMPWAEHPKNETGEYVCMDFQAVKA
jgi:hypothetical protein